MSGGVTVLESNDLEDYWNEVKVIQGSTPPLHTPPDPADQDPEEEPASDDCLDERGWLEAAGLAEVTEPAFLSGREISEKELQAVLRSLTRDQAAAVRRRVELLNRTVRQRPLARQRFAPKSRKPDIRDVFRDVESCSNGSRSRSGTPDSLDSETSSPPSPPSPSSPPNSHLPVRFAPSSHSTVYRLESKRRPHLASNQTVLPHHTLFRRASRSNGDIVASEAADGIRMVAYQRIGSVRVRERSRSGSDPMNLNNISDASTNQHSVVCVTRSHDSLFDATSQRRNPTLGFEELWAGNSSDGSDKDTVDGTEGNKDQYEDPSGRTVVDFLAEDDLATLHPLLFMELTAVFDQAGVSVTKIKPHKRKRKEDGSIFGVSLVTLLERDRQIANEPHSVPLVFQKVLGELERRGLNDEGLLRVSGNKQRVESLVRELEKEFYSRPEMADRLLAQASPHELTTVLKRLLRLLPEPLLTNQLLHLFYLAHGVPDCYKAVNLLICLLPPENRATLYVLLTFLCNIVVNETTNKMSLHNVAMIIAPSLFPPSVLVGKNGLKAELDLAVQCCKLTELMMEKKDLLWIVPNYLIAQLRDINEQNRGHTKENKPVSRLLAKSHRGEIYSMGDNFNCIREDTIEIRVDAPQFRLSSVPIVLDKRTTAADVVLKIVELGGVDGGGGPQSGNSLGPHQYHRGGGRALSELAPNGNLSCLLSTGDPDTALQTHFMYEIGGNIGQRRLEPSVQMLAVLQDNPQCQWILKCDHRNGSHRILKRV